MTLLSTWPGLRRFAVHRALWGALAVGLALKAVILLTHSITFDADEAVLGLMARHILQGELPLFFYGQSYMGALDAYLTVPFFLIFGQTVIAMRLLQVGLFAGVLVSTYCLALRLDGDRFGAFAAASLVAVPPVLVSLYTTSTLGDYVEILLFNNLILLVGADLISARKRAVGWWLALGFLGGLGWWSMGSIVITLAPVAIIVLIRMWGRLPWRGLGFAGAGFVVGAAPWLYATLAHGLGATVSDLSGTWFTGPGTFGDRALSLILFNLPALFGLRPPWSVDWIALPVGLVVAALYLIAIWQAGKASLKTLKGAHEPDILAALIILGWFLLLVIFLLTPFGGDPTGRYLLPLYPGLAVLAGRWLASIRRGTGVIPERYGEAVAWAILVVCVGYNLWGNIRAIGQNPPGLTKQFDPISQIPEDHDAELIQFLDSIGADRGYSNYWITFRFAFITGERIVFSPRLPYKANLSYTYGDDRYPEYSRQVNSAQQVVYVTSNHPALDEKLAQRLDELGVTFKTKRIGASGPYTVFYDLSRKVTPDEIGPFGEVSGRAIHGNE